MVAQAALETGWLSHPTLDIKTKKDSYNLFNIKGTGWTGETALVKTTEYEAGRPYQTVARFRAYPSYAESFEDYAKLLTTKPRYSKAMAAKNDPGKYVEELQLAGYATDPLYANKLKQIMRKHMGVPC